MRQVLDVSLVLATRVNKLWHVVGHSKRLAQLKLGAAHGKQQTFLRWTSATLCDELWLMSTESTRLAC